MTRGRSKKPAADPLLRDCTACGARAGEGCRSLDSLPLTVKGSRLVHAARLEGATDA